MYQRNTLKEGASLYLPPTLYTETFVTYQDNFLPTPRDPAGNGERYRRELLGSDRLPLPA